MATKSESKVIKASISIQTRWHYSDQPNPTFERLMRLLLECRNHQFPITAEIKTDVKKEVR